MPDAVVYLISQPYLSGRRFKQLSAGLHHATPLPCAIVKMEGVGESAMDALEALAAEGARDILVQPVGLPFSDSLMAWLPNALGYWQRKCAPQGTVVRLANDQIGAERVLAAVVEAALDSAANAAPVNVDTGSMDGKGWDEVPPYHDHLLVCIGPRCAYRRGGLLRDVLNAQLSRHGLMRDTLVATTGCLFPCNGGPVVAHYPAGRWYRLETEADVSTFVETVLVERRPLPQFVIHEVPQNAFT